MLNEEIRLLRNDVADLDVAKIQELYAIVHI